MADALRGSFHKYPGITTAVAFSTGIVCSVGDVIVCGAGDASHIPTACVATGALCAGGMSIPSVSAVPASKLSTGGGSGLAVFTGIVTTGGTLSLAVTSIGGDIGVEVAVFSGDSSAAPNAVATLAPTADSATYSVNLVTTVLCSLFCMWLNEGSDVFSSFLSSMSLINHDTSHFDAGSYKLGVAAATTPMGINSTGAGGTSTSIVAIAIPVTTGGGGFILGRAYGATKTIGGVF